MAEHRKQDQRVARTRQRLAAALIDLILEQGYEPITIREIVQRAGVGYATYFRHFPDKESLLLDALDRYLAELIALVRQQPAGVHAGRQLFDFVGSRPQLSRVFLLSTSAGLADRVIDAGMQSVFAGAMARTDAEIPPDLAAFHIASASLALVRWWLAHDMPYEPDKMGAIYDRLVLQPSLTAAFLDEPAALHSPAGGEATRAHNDDIPGSPGAVTAKKRKSSTYDDEC